MKKQTDSLWTSTFIRLSTINFSVILVFYLLMITMASFAGVKFHATSSSSGLIVGIYVVGAVLGRLLSGRLMQVFSENLLMKVGLGCFTLLMAGYFYAPNLLVLGVVRFVHGMTAGVALTGLTTQLTKELPLKRKSEGISYFSMSTTIGTAIGPFLGIYLGEHTSFSMIFLGCLLVACFAFVLSLTVKSFKEEAAQITEAPKQRARLIEPKVFPIGLMMLFLGAGYAVILSFLNAYAKERNLLTGASLFFVVYALVVLVTRPFTGRWMDQKGVHGIMVVAFCTFALGLILIGSAHSNTVLLLAAAFVGFGFGNLQSGGQALAISKVPAADTGVATSTYFIGMDSGLGLSPYVLGLALPLVGYSGLYMVMSLIILVVFVVYLAAHLKAKVSHK